MKTVGYAAHNSDAEMVPYHFERQHCAQTMLRLKFCSAVSSLRPAHSERRLGASAYPLVPGHEIVGRVIEVGSDVKNYKVGDNVGVGCMVDSCQECTVPRSRRTVLPCWHDPNLQSPDVPMARSPRATRSTLSFVKSLSRRIPIPWICLKPLQFCVLGITPSRRCAP